ncbi:hypothetical protein TD95_003443, partial [Thielaviopsis punctulata]
MSETTTNSGDEALILAGLNAAQRRAVCTDSNCVAILAGPGCGKTHTLTSRVAYLIDQRGYDPRNIIVATFTVKAAREMRDRIGHMVGEERQKKLIIGTFHGVATRYLAIYGHLIGVPKKFGIVDAGESREIVKRILNRLDLKYDPASITGYISREKSRGVSGTDYPSSNPSSALRKHVSPEYKTIYKEYQRYLQEMEMLDYDDLLVRCVELLQKFPTCVSNIEAVLIDEYQDTNTTQYELLKLFACAKGRITVVGDPDQSIYAWRSAEVRNLQRLIDEYPGTEEVALEQNYRSSAKIIDCSMRVIAQDKDRYEKGLVSVHKAGTKPTLRNFESANNQATWIAREVTRITHMTGNAIQWKDIAVLMRASSASRLIETALANEGIRYCMIGGFRFYDRAEIKLIMDYLRAISLPKNNEAFSRIVNEPKRYIGPVTIRNLLMTAETTHEALQDIVARHMRPDFPGKSAFNRAQQNRICKLMDLLKEARALMEKGEDGKEFNIVRLIELILDRLQFKEHLEKTYKEDHESRWDNVQELLSAAREFVNEFEDIPDDLPEVDGIEQKKHLNMLDSFLINAAMVSGQNETLKDEDGKGSVTLSTIHAAKGLEWPVVFVPNVHDGSIPFTKFGDVNYPEERRLLYVAMTRAKALLYLSYPMHESFGYEALFHSHPSKFLRSIENNFAKKSPSFTASVLSDLSSILHRDFPSIDAVYKGLPEMMVTEDAMFSDVADGSSKTHRLLDDGGRKRKRPDMDIGATRSWNPGYSTTMGQSANFTMGFIPASNLSIQPDKTRATSTSKATGRPSNSKTRVGAHMPSNSRTSHTLAKTTMANAVQHPPCNPATTTIGTKENSLPPHKLPAVNHGLWNHSLGQPCDAQKVNQEIKFSEGYTQAGKYPQFSSSPPRPEPMHLRYSHNTAGGGAAGKKTHPEVIVIDDDDDVTIDPAAQPAQTLHKTTMTTSFGGFHRPTGINRLNGPDKMARIQNVGKPPRTGAGSANKPFKMPAKRDA